MIDTLRLAQRLSDAGMPREQADVFAEALGDELRQSAVTKGDLNVTVADLKAALADAKSELYRVIAVQTLVLLGAMVGLKLFT